MESLSDELERQLRALERKRDQYLKQLESAEDGVRHKRFSRLIAVVDDRIWTKRLALQATYERRGNDCSVAIEALGEIVELEVHAGEPEEDGVAFAIISGPEDLEEATTRVFRWPTAPYPIVCERFVGREALAR